MPISRGIASKKLAVCSMKKRKSNGFVDHLSSLSPRYLPKSENQKKYVHLLADPTRPIVLGVGPAGCGKTLFACIEAIHKLKSGEVQKIIITRPIVPVEHEELGFLPGNIIHKMDPWTRPIFDIFLEYYQQRDLDAMLVAGVIEIAPLAYMRGRTFKRSFIIADEMQNSTPNQMMMLTTRIGDLSKMVITGDLKQSDRSSQNGLFDLMSRLRVYNGDSSIDHSKIAVAMVEMTYSDIERSPIVAKILDIYNRKMNVTVVDSVLLPTPSDNITTIVKPFDLKTAAKKNDAALIPLNELPRSRTDHSLWS
jgi:phosphate starvation-inducible PhoH-like protein